MYLVDELWQSVLFPRQSHVTQTDERNIHRVANHII